MFEKPIIMLDFETTGMSPDQGDRITEVAALKIQGTEVVDRFVSLINCKVRIPAFITQLTGISQSMVNGAPSVEHVMPQLLAFIGDNALSAHNASFDEKFLIAESQRLNLLPQHSSLICSVKLARRVFPGLPSYALGNLAKSLGIRFNGNAHRAEADAEVSSQLILKIAASLKERYGVQHIDPHLLQKLTSVTAAKVPTFLDNHFLNTSTPKPVKKTKATKLAIEVPTKVPTKAAIKKHENHSPVLYRHYKGGIYEFLHEATQESDLSDIIVYRSPQGGVWTRSKDNFFEMIEVNGIQVQRFSEIID